MLTSSLKLPAPAKINLFLHICGQRNDGYHNLQTAFQFLDIADQLNFSCRADGDINLNTAFFDVATEDNLIVKAARTLKQLTNCTLGVDIDIDKILPMGAGLGGGSSNAATTLLALNHLWQLHLSQEQLKKIGVKLGADVPIFIHGHAAWAEGIGEQLSNIDITEKWYLLVIPTCHVSTATIFSHSELTRDTKMMTIAAFLEQGNLPTFRNDCESLVRKLYPEVDQALTALSNFSEARMTGTGACIYASFNTREEAQQVSAKISKKFSTVICKGINQSPLQNALSLVN